MDLNPWNIAIGFLGTVVVALGAYFGIVRQSRSSETKMALEAWKEFVHPLREEVERLSARVESLEQALADERAGREADAERHQKERLALLRRIRTLEKKTEENSE